MNQSALHELGRAGPTRKAIILSVALLIAGCVSAADELAKTPVGYVPDIDNRVAAVEWREVETLTVSLTEYAFSPMPMRLTAGKPYRLILKNEGDSIHYFVSEDFFRAIAARRLETPDGVIATPRLVSIAVKAGDTKILEFVPVKPGMYELECTAPLHALFGMFGTIEVT